LADASARSVLPTYSVRLRHRIGALRIDAEFVLTQPWTILFGPSGSGKTTILRAIAGLLRPDEVKIVQTTMPGTAMERRTTLAESGAGIFVPAHRRGIPLAPQQPSLFPHMTVAEHLMYGTAEVAGRRDARLAAETMRRELEAFGLAHLAGAHPGRLSGGEAQRLNLARAVTATGAGLLLLDEPFTGMDAARREQLLPYLRDRMAQSLTPVLSVTHDVTEAFQLNAEVIELAEGRVVQQGAARVVLAEERARMLRQLNPVG